MYNYVNITVQRSFKLHLILTSYPNCQGTMKTLFQWQQLLLKYMVVMFLIDSLDVSCLPTTDEWLCRYSILSRGGPSIIIRRRLSSRSCFRHDIPVNFSGEKECSTWPFESGIAKTSSTKLTMLLHLKVSAHLYNFHHTSLYEFWTKLTYCFAYYDTISSHSSCMTAMLTPASWMGVENLEIKSSIDS